MIQGAEQNITNRLTRERVSCSFDKADLKRFLEVLQERLDAAADLEEANFQQHNQTADEFENNKQLLRSGFKVRPTVTGKNGQELFGTVEDVFDSPNFPEVVKSVFIGSEIFLKASYNYTVRNSFEIFLDFSRPEILDFTLLPSQRTPNETNFKVQGIDATWVNGVFHEIQSFVDEHKAPAPWLHGHSIYEKFLFLGGYPIGFWLCFKTSPFLPDGGNTFLFIRAAIYVYIFFLTMVGLRALFHYARWVFPIAEYKHTRSKSLKHRAILGTLVLSLVGAVLYDLLKTIVGG